MLALVTSQLSNVPHMQLVCPCISILILFRLSVQIVQRPTGKTPGQTAIHVTFSFDVGTFLAGGSY